MRARCKATRCEHQLRTDTFSSRLARRFAPLPLQRTLRCWVPTKPGTGTTPFTCYTRLHPNKNKKNKTSTTFTLGRHDTTSRIRGWLLQGRLDGLHDDVAGNEWIFTPPISKSSPDGHRGTETTPFVIFWRVESLEEKKKRQKDGYVVPVPTAE